MTIVRGAVVQLNAGPAIADNLREAEALIRAAAKDGATLIATPENTCRMRATAEQRWETSFPVEENPSIPFFSRLAENLNVTLIIGSIASIRVSERKLANRSFVFGRDGAVVATYDKIHLFDVDLPNGDKYRESDTIEPGRETVMVAAEGADIGLSVCYDVRFPDIYRHMARKGAQILSIPAAFTVPTGQAHWEILLRARAIENGAFVIAAAQAGTHEGGRATYGHSMIIAPWGNIIAQIQGDKQGYVVADMDLDEVQKARAAIPSLAHGKN